MAERDPEAARGVCYDPADLQGSARPRGNGTSRCRAAVWPRGLMPRSGMRSRANRRQREHRPPPTTAAAACPGSNTTPSILSRWPVRRRDPGQEHRRNSGREERASARGRGHVTPPCLDRPRPRYQRCDAFTRARIKAVLGGPGGPRAAHFGDQRGGRRRRRKPVARPFRTGVPRGRS